MVSHVELIGRIVFGAALGAVIGYERHARGRPVGLRTHLLVAMAAACFMVVSTQFVHFQGYHRDALAGFDGDRIAASVVAGIGFLAGGAILRGGATVHGLTTAAGLWLVTAIGLCAGGGMFVEAAAVTGLGVLALSGLRRVEHKDDRLRRRLTLILGEEAASVSTMVSVLREHGATVTELSYERRFGDRRRVELTLDVRVPARVGLASLIEQLERQPGVRRLRVEAAGA